VARWIRERLNLDTHMSKPTWARTSRRLGRGGDAALVVSILEGQRSILGRVCLPICSPVAMGEAGAFILTRHLVAEDDHRPSPRFNSTRSGQVPNSFCATKPCGRNAWHALGGIDRHVLIPASLCPAERDRTFKAGGPEPIPSSAPVYKQQDQLRANDGEVRARLLGTT